MHGYAYTYIRVLDVLMMQMMGGRLGLLAKPVFPLVQHIAITQRPLSQKG
jgi:hypothetical protein